MTFDQITAELLAKPNCSMKCKFRTIENLHSFVHVDIELVKSHPKPKGSVQCRMLKEFLLYLLTEFDSIPKRAPNVKWK